MKMKLIHKITGLRSLPKIYGKYLFYIDKKSEELFGVDVNTFKANLHIQEKLYSITIINDKLLSYGLNIYTLEGEKLYSGGTNYSYEVNYKNLTLWKTVDNEKEIALYHIFDIENMDFKKKNIDLVGVPYAFIEKNIFTQSKFSIACQDIEKCEVIWQFDITQFGPYKEWDFIKKVWKERRRKVNRIYFYRGKLIVTLSRAIIALEPQTGKLLWKIDFENCDPVNLVFDEDKAYLGRLINFYVLDIDEGNIIYERPYDPKYRFEVAGYQLSQIVYHGLALHDGYIWFTHGSNGRQFLLKANPANGEILEGMLLDTNYSTGMPIFQDNRMYIRDQVGDLYVYEEVEEGSVAATEQEEEEVYTQVLDVKGKKHVLIYAESWSRELEDKLERFLIQYWVNGKLKRGDEVKFVFKRTEGINHESLHDEVIKFLDCDRVRAILSSISSKNVKALTGKKVHPEYQPYWLVNFFKERENFRKYFEVVE